MHNQFILAYFTCLLIAMVDTESNDNNTNKNAGEVQSFTNPLQWYFLFERIIVARSNNVIGLGSYLHSL
jgi:hypothetical protein